MSGDAEKSFEEIESIARIAHEVNRLYSERIGEVPHPPWDQFRKEGQRQFRIGVQSTLACPGVSAEETHQKWMESHRDAGWKYGLKYDAAAKTHPNMVAYDALPENQKRKDHLFLAVVRALGEPL